MTKYLKRIGIIIFILFVILQNWCFADVAYVPTTSEVIKGVSKAVIIMLLIVIGIVTFIMSVISIFTLRHMSRKEKKLDEIDDEEAFEKVKKRVYRRSTALAIILIICFKVFTEFSYTNIFGLIILLMLLISITVRLNNKEKLSNVFWKIGMGLTVFFVVLSIGIKITAEIYNYKYLQYVTNREYIYGYENINDFVNELIENDNDKIKVFYKNEYYTENLESLREVLAINLYSIEFVYKNYYIQEIYIGEYVTKSAFNAHFYHYAGKCLGSSVKSLIDDLISNVATNSDTTAKIPDVYFYSEDGTDDEIALSGDGETVDENYTTDLSNIRSKISNSHNYMVEFTEYNDDGFISKIVITY